MSTTDSPTALPIKVKSEPELACPKTSLPETGLLTRQKPDQEAAQKDNQLSTTRTQKSGSSNSQASLASSYEPLSFIQKVVGDEALKEEERAAEKIKQKLRAMPMLHKNKTQAPQNEDRMPQQPYSSQDSQTELPELSSNEQGNISIEQTFSSKLDLGQEQRRSIPNIDDLSVENVSSITETSQLKGKQKSKKANKDPALIEIEAPKLIDAQTEPGDRRYFQCPGDPKPEKDFEYDFLYQHQRGAFFLGTPKFSSKSLLPIDPDEWTNEKFEISAMNISNYVVPDPSWEWVHKSWLVDMTGDVDEDGWEYAMAFHGSSWHGNYEVFRSFARRRRWIRLRKRKGKTLQKPCPLPERTYPTSVDFSTWTKRDMDGSSPFPSDDIASNDDDPHTQTKPVDLYKVLKKARSDREKLAYIAQYVVRYPGQLNEIEQRLDRYLNLLDYEASRRDFLILLNTYSPTKKDVVTRTAEQLEFYSD
ncbi:hypothetical protein BX616_004593, partial [Lobosporangium transversale]